MGARQSSGSGTVSSSNSPRLYTQSSVPGSSSRSNDTSSTSRGNSGRPITVPPLDLRQRTRSLSNVMSNGPGSSQGPSLLSMAGLPFGLSSGSPDSDTSTEDVASFGRVFSAHSLPVHIVPFNGMSSVDIIISMKYLYENLILNLLSHYNCLCLCHRNQVPHLF